MTTTVVVNEPLKPGKSAKEKCCTLKGKLGFIKFNFNPVVTLFSALIIWSMVVWCVVFPAKSLQQLTVWKGWITRTWTWFYIGTQNIWIIFILILYFSKYASLKLGKDDEKPEYNDATYFTMLFAAGVGIGLFYFGVAEPVFHFEPGKTSNRYQGRYALICSLIILHVYYVLFYRFELLRIHQGPTWPLSSVETHALQIILLTSRCSVTEGPFELK